MGPGVGMTEDLPDFLKVPGWSWDDHCAVWRMREMSATWTADIYEGYQVVALVLDVGPFQITHDEVDFQDVEIYMQAMRVAMQGMLSAVHDCHMHLFDHLKDVN